MKSRVPVPLPACLAHLQDEQLRPPLLRTDEVRILVEFWNFTINGEEFVKKLIRCGVLVPVKLKRQRGNRFETSQVLALYETERC